MKINYIKGVYKKNLGDDLLIKLLCERYPKEYFCLLNYRNGNKKTICKNLQVNNINSTIYQKFNNLFARFGRINPIEKRKINKSKYVVVIGGSLFMERKNYKLDKKIFNLYWYKKLTKPYLIIGSNIGPVYTDEYVNTIKENIISKAEYVCLRDKKSYKYVSDCKNVNVGTDIVFSMDNKWTSEKENKKVIFSVINIDKKKNQIINPNTEKYEKTIDDMIDFFKTKGYEIELFSFCKSEGDEEAIKKILSKRNDDRIKTYMYDGNIDEALNELSTASVIVGTRFHANVIGMIMNKTIIPIIYNDKTRELLNDINFKGKYVDIDSIDEFSIDDITDKDLTYKINIDKFKKLAEKHFEYLDKNIKGNDSNE